MPRAIRSSIFTVFTVALIVLLFCVPVFSSPVNDAKDELDSINEQIEENSRKIDETKQKESNLLKEISDVDGELETIEDQLVELIGQLNTVGNTCEEIEAELMLTQEEQLRVVVELERLEKQLLKQNDILNTRLKNIYKQGELTYLEVLLNADDFSDLLNRVSFFCLVVEQDTSLLSQIELTKKEAQAKKSQLDECEFKIKEKQKALEEEKNNLEILKRGEELKREEIQSELSHKEELLERVSHDRAALEQAEKELEKSSQEIAEYIRLLESGSDSPRPTGSFQWPTAGPVTSGYGMRWHPIFRVYKMHTGIDIGAPYGQNIVAAQSGTVIFVGRKGGYGQTLIIDHGGGIATLSAHASAIYVGEGQGVDKGQKVAAVGSTGYSTGPHLHFEVRVNGQHQNPMNWF